MALRQGLSHVLSTNLYRVSASGCFGGVCQRRCISMATCPKISGETARLSRGVNGHSLSHLNAFHWSSLLRSEAQKDTKWITEKYGTECVIIPLKLTDNVKLWKIVLALSDISKELGVGYSINIEDKKKAEVSLYGKSTEEAEKAGKALLEKMEQKEKRKKDLLKSHASVHMPKSMNPAISLDEVLRFLKSTRRKELMDIEDNLGCRIFVRFRRVNCGIDVECDDAEKRREAINQVKTLFKDAEKTLLSFKFLSFSLPSEINVGHNLAMICQALAKDWEKDLSFYLELGESPSIRLRAPSLELAEKFKEHLMENVPKKIEEFQNLYKEMIEIPSKPTRSFLRSVLPMMLSQQSSENLHYQIRKGSSSEFECVVYGSDPAEVKKLAEQIKLIDNIVLTSPDGEQKAEANID